MVEPLKHPDVRSYPDRVESTSETVVRPLNPAPASAPVTRVNIDSDPGTLRDTVRWGPILGGLFTVFSTLVLLTVLGLAVGLSAVDPGDRLSGFGMGAGWWGALSALLAFAVGGWVAGATASVVRGRPHGAVNGFMVWAVAIPVMLFALTGGLTSAIGTTAQVAGPVAAQAVESSGLDPASLPAAVRGGGVGQTAGGTQGAMNVSEQQVAKVADTASTGLWWTFASLIFAMLAAVLGGTAGGRWHAARTHDIHTTAVAA